MQLLAKKTENGIQYPYTRAMLSVDYPDTVFPSALDQETIDALGLEQVFETTPPKLDADPRFTYMEGQPVRVNGRLTQTWDATPASADRAIASYTAKLEQFYDDKAKERRYANRYTCALRAGYAGPFHAEGVAFASWMDTCNAHAYQIMAEVLAGQRQMPSIEELIADLPTLTWP